MAAGPSEAIGVEGAVGAPAGSDMRNGICDQGKLSEMGSDDDSDGEMLMMRSLLDGGRKLGMYGGGALYEKASNTKGSSRKEKRRPLGNRSTQALIRPRIASKENGPG